jgi:hypothetical protein
MEIVDKLNTLGKVVMARYPYINCGGCCVYAAMVAEELQKHGIDAKGIVAAYSAKELNTNGVTLNSIRPGIKSNTLAEWNNHGVRFNHVGVEFVIKKEGKRTGTKKHYDSTGVKRATTELDYMPIYKGRLELADLKALARKRKGWNESFNRRSIPALRKLVKEHLGVDSTATPAV